MADIPKVQSLDDVLRWLDRLERATRVRSTNAWTMRAVLDHLAQSIEMSLDGFPHRKARCSRPPPARRPLPFSSGAAA